MRDAIDEGCANSFDVSFFSVDDVPAAPGTVHWHLKDITNCRTLVDWTEVPAASVVTIEIDAQYNVLYSQEIGQQRNALTVMANRGLPKQNSKEFQYVIRNLKGVS